MSLQYVVPLSEGLSTADAHAGGKRQPYAAVPRSLLATAQPGSRAREPLAADHYLTDGRRLFRVVSQFTTTLCPFAELEDCRTLKTRRYSPAELYGMALRPVRAAGENAS